MTQHGADGDTTPDGIDRPAPDDGASMTRLTYTLDPDNTIIAVTGNWDGFALDNGGSEILSAKILGRRVEEFITGDVTLMFVRTMLTAARTLNRVIQRQYRCDSPQLKRLMEMDVVPCSQGTLEIRHHLIRSEPYQHVIPIDAIMTSSGASFVKRCSICNRIRAQQVWSEIDDAINAGHLTTGNENRLRVVYGVCPECLAQRSTRA